MPPLLRRSLTLCLVLSACLLTQAEIKLPRLLSDHMVLQRDRPIHLWGWADPNESVTLSFHEQTRTTSANDLGQWSAYLDPEPAGGPYQLTVRGAANTLTLADILVGDVWLASGQSNMEMPLEGFPGSAVVHNVDAEIARASAPEIRLLRIEKTASPHPLDDIAAASPALWTSCTPATARSFSAVAYFFGREIQQREHVPIGLIDTTWGGTPVEAWVSLDSISADASLMPVFSAYAQMSDEQADMPRVIAREKREDAAAKAANQPAPKHPWHPDPASWVPAALFNGMVAPFTPFGIRGVLWYQGESNSGQLRAGIYEQVFSTLIRDWRTQWRQGSFPFLFAQISSFTSDATETWGTIRDAQRRTLALDGTGMAVTLDVGNPDNVHPADKQTVGARLALAARALAYGEAVEYSGPLFRQAVPEDGAMRIWFDHGSGLAAHGPSLRGMEVAGADRHFVTATARIEGRHSSQRDAGESVLASSPEVPAPRYVRYAWSNATDANLYNAAGLPASTFTSEPRLPQPCHSACK